MDNKQPGITLNLDSERISIYKSTLEVLDYPEFYRFLFNMKQNQLVIQPCGIDDAGAHRLPEIRQGESYELKSKDMVRLLYRNNPWNHHKSYHAMGAAYPDQKTVNFQLDTAKEIKE